MSFHEEGISILSNGTTFTKELTLVYNIQAFPITHTESSCFCLTVAISLLSPLTLHWFLHLPSYCPPYKQVVLLLTRPHKPQCTLHSLFPGTRRRHRGCFARKPGKQTQLMSKSKFFSCAQIILCFLPV